MLTTSAKASKKRSNCSKLRNQSRNPRSSLLPPYAQPPPPLSRTDKTVGSKTLLKAHISSSPHHNTHTRRSHAHNPSNLQNNPDLNRVYNEAEFVEVEGFNICESQSPQPDTLSFKAPPKPIQRSHLSFSKPLKPDQLDISDLSHQSSTLTSHDLDDYDGFREMSELSDDHISAQSHHSHPHRSSNIPLNYPHPSQEPPHDDLDEFLTLPPSTSPLFQQNLHQELLAQHTKLQREFQHSLLPQPHQRYAQIPQFTSLPQTDLETQSQDYATNSTLPDRGLDSSSVRFQRGWKEFSKIMADGELDQHGKRSMGNADPLDSSSEFNFTFPVPIRDARLDGFLQGIQQVPRIDNQNPPTVVIQGLVDWMTKYGAIFHDGIELRPEHHANHGDIEKNSGSWGIFATKDIDAMTILAVIPCPIMLFRSHPFGNILTGKSFHSVATTRIPSSPPSSETYSSLPNSTSNTKQPIYSTNKAEREKAVAELGKKNQHGLAKLTEDLDVLASNSRQREIQSFDATLLAMGDFRRRLFIEFAHFENSHFKPYLATLPKFFPTLPSLWSAKLKKNIDPWSNSVFDVDEKAKRPKTMLRLQSYFDPTPLTSSLLTTDLTHDHHTSKTSLWLDWSRTFDTLCNKVEYSESRFFYIDALARTRTFGFHDSDELVELDSVRVKIAKLKKLQIYIRQFGVETALLDSINAAKNSSDPSPDTQQRNDLFDLPVELLRDLLKVLKQSKWQDESFRLFDGELIVSESEDDRKMKNADNDDSELESTSTKRKSTTHAFNTGSRRNKVAMDDKLALRRVLQNYIDGAYDHRATHNAGGAKKYTIHDAPQYPIFIPFIDQLNYSSNPNVDFFTAKYGHTSIKPDDSNGQIFDQDGNPTISQAPLIYSRENAVYLFSSKKICKGEELFVQYKAPLRSEFDKNYQGFEEHTLPSPITDKMNDSTALIQKVTNIVENATISVLDDEKGRIFGPEAGSNILDDPIALAEANLKPKVLVIQEKAKKRTKAQDTTQSDQSATKYNTGIKPNPSIDLHELMKNEPNDGQSFASPFVDGVRDAGNESQLQHADSSKQPPSSHTKQINKPDKHKTDEPSDQVKSFENDPVRIQHYFPLGDLDRRADYFPLTPLLTASLPRFPFFNPSSFSCPPVASHFSMINHFGIMDLTLFRSHPAELPDLSHPVLPYQFDANFLQNPQVLSKIVSNANRFHVQATGHGLLDRVLQLPAVDKDLPYSDAAIDSRHSRRKDAEIFANLSSPLLNIDLVQLSATQTRSHAQQPLGNPSNLTITYPSMHIEQTEVDLAPLFQTFSTEFIYHAKPPQISAAFDIIHSSGIDRENRIKQLQTIDDFASLHLNNQLQPRAATHTAQSSQQPPSDRSPDAPISPVILAFTPTQTNTFQFALNQVDPRLESFLSTLALCLYSPQYSKSNLRTFTQDRLEYFAYQHGTPIPSRTRLDPAVLTPLVEPSLFLFLGLCQTAFDTVGFSWGDSKGNQSTPAPSPSRDSIPSPSSLPTVESTHFPTSTNKGWGSRLKSIFGFFSNSSKHSPITSSSRDTSREHLLSRSPSRSNKPSVLDLNSNEKKIIKDSCTTSSQFYATMPYYTLQHLFNAVATPLNVENQFWDLSSNKIRMNPPAPSPPSHSFISTSPNSNTKVPPTTQSTIHIHLDQWSKSQQFPTPVVRTMPALSEFALPYMNDFKS